MDSQLDTIFNGIMFFDANETVAKHSAYPKRLFEVYVFFIIYSGFGLGFFFWFLLPLYTSGQMADAQKPARAAVKESCIPQHS